MEKQYIQALQSCMYGERVRNALRQAGWLNLPGVTQVPHEADSEHGKIAQQVRPLANDLTLHRAHPALTGQKTEDKPASDGDLNATSPQAQNSECVISKGNM